MIQISNICTFYLAMLSAHSTFREGFICCEWVASEYFQFGNTNKFYRKSASDKKLKLNFLPNNVKCFLKHGITSPNIFIKTIFYHRMKESKRVTNILL